jgi:hypothetical protein
MSGMAPDERLQVAFERYRRVMAVHPPSTVDTPVDVAVARIDLTLRLVEAGERLPEPVAEQLQEDALLLVAETEALPT